MHYWDLTQDRCSNYPPEAEAGNQKDAQTQESAGDKLRHVPIPRRHSTGQCQHSPAKAQVHPGLLTHEPRLHRVWGRPKWQASSFIGVPERAVKGKNASDWNTQGLQKTMNDACLILLMLSAVAEEPNSRGFHNYESLCQNP